MGRCLLHSHRPRALLPVAKDWVASGHEVMAFGRCAQFLMEAGVPLARQPAYSGIGLGDESAISQMLHPRIQGALLGAWGQPEERAALERQGLRRIDFLLADLPIPSPEQDLSPEDMAAALLLRAAAWNHRWVLPLSDLGDVSEMQRQWAGQGDFEKSFRETLALKSLVLLGELDGAMSRGLRGGQREDSPESWVFQARSVDGLRFAERGGWRFGLYADKFREGESVEQLALLSGSGMPPRILLDADLAVRCLDGQLAPAVVLVHNSGLCGFEVVRSDEDLSGAFARSKRSDPRGAFGAVMGVNCPVDAALARALEAAFLEAVVAPDFDAEARASLGKTRIRLLRSSMGSAGGHGSFCRSTRWGNLLGWSEVQADPELLTLSKVAPSPAQARALAHAWRLARSLPGIAMVAADEHCMRAAAWAQTSLREAAQLLAQKLGMADAAVVVACDSSFRFVEDVRILADCGVGALLHLSGSPRQEEITARVDELGLVIQAMDERVVAGKA